jgi:transcription-repair coupling factor (superfamily II helicase)
MTHLADQKDTLKQLLARFSEDLWQRVASGTARRINNIPVPLLAVLLAHCGKKFLVVEDTPEHAEMLLHDIRFFSAACGYKPVDIECLRPPSSPELIGERARIIQAMSGQRISHLITSADAIKTGFTAGDVSGLSISISKGMNIERATLEASLISLGYRKVNIVMEKGEYAERGWLFDVYPSTEELPVRIEFYGDEVDIIRTFDIETQRSVKKMNELLLYPAAEIIPEDSENGADANKIWEIRDAEIFANMSADMDVRTLSKLKPKPLLFSHFAFSGEGIDSGALAMSGLGILPEERRADDDLASGVDNLKKKVFIVLPVTAQIERTKEILSAGNLAAPVIPAGEVCSYEGAICLTPGKLSAGLHLPDLLLLTGRELFGEQPAYRPIKRSRVSKLLLTIDDLKPGDFVVHKDHGIGKFIGLHKESIEGFEADIITIEYARGDKLHIPFQGIEKLSKYSGGEGSVPALDRLGSSSWQNTKKRARKSVMDMAEKLLTLYAERRASRGFVFSDDTSMHAEFDDFFPYEETEDQIKSMQAIKKHMQSDQPMDMLICGDVGYGKTEVAIKAAFRAVYDGKQVAVLVPTTLLAEQHFRTFKSRFTAFPVRIDYLSRFKNSRNARKTTEALAKGEIDIIIGTHMLLNKSVQFQDLGLLIIDEEHRFGVAQKERVKELRRDVDVITLTATPIPRTLHMSLSGIREMETIETPPEERLAVRSTVAKRSDSMIKEAIER